MYEHIPTIIELAVILAAVVAAYARLAAELKVHIIASELRFSEHIAADDSQHKDRVLRAVYELEVKHLSEKLEEISGDLRELKRLIVLPQGVRRDLM